MVIIKTKMSLFGLSWLLISAGERRLNTKNSFISKELLGTFIMFKPIVPLFSNNVLTSYCGLWLKVLGLLNQRDSSAELESSFFKSHFSCEILS